MHCLNKKNNNNNNYYYYYYYYYYTCLMALFPGLPRWGSTRKVKPIWISLKQETVSGSGISWAICKSAPRSRQITTPAPHHSVFYRSDALLAAQPTASKHWRQPSKHWRQLNKKNKRTLNSSWTKKANHQSIIHVAWKQPVCLLKSN